MVWPFEDDLDLLFSETKSQILLHLGICSIGWQNGIRLYLAAFDVCVFPSYWESFPNVILQVGTMSLPCIVTDINGRNEIIARGVNGVIIPSKDEVRLYSAMDSILHHSSQRMEKSVHARQ